MPYQPCSLPPVRPLEVAHQAGERISLGTRQVRFLVLREQGEQVEWHRLTMKVVDHADAATLAATADGKPDLPHSTRSLHETPARWVSGDNLHDRVLLRFRQVLRSSSQVRRRLEDGDPGSRHAVH